MEPNFLDEGCDVFMNESDVRLEKRIEGERFEKISSVQKMMILKCN
jgi:hypothetical protein